MYRHDWCLEHYQKNHAITLSSREEVEDALKNAVDTIRPNLQLWRNKLERRAEAAAKGDYSVQSTDQPVAVPLKQVTQVRSFRNHVQLSLHNHLNHGRTSGSILALYNYPKRLVLLLRMF